MEAEGQYHGQRQWRLPMWLCSRAKAKMSRIQKQRPPHLVEAWCEDCEDWRTYCDDECNACGARLPDDPNWSTNIGKRTSQVSNPTSDLLCAFCLVEGKPHLYPDPGAGGDAPRCPVDDSHGYLAAPGEPCCGNQSIQRDDLGKFDGSGDAGGPSWVCTNCGDRTTW